MTNELKRKLPETFYEYRVFNLRDKDQWSTNIPFLCTKCGNCCTYFMYKSSGAAKCLTGKPSEEKIAWINKRLHEYREENKNKDDKKIPCPYYQKNSCEIYDNRPEGCKNFPVHGFIENLQNCEPFIRYMRFVDTLIKHHDDYLSWKYDTFEIAGFDGGLIKQVKLSDYRLKKCLAELKKEGMTHDEEELFKALNGENRIRRRHPTR